MSEDYATGIVHSTQEFIADSLPETLRQELREGRGLIANRDTKR